MLFQQKYSRNVQAQLHQFWKKYKILRTLNFPDKLKLADITPFFKKNNPLEKENYRLVSVLPVVSNIFERLMRRQETLFTEKLLSSYLCLQYTAGIDFSYWKMEKDFGSKRVWRAELMDLSKTFDTSNYDLLLAKLYSLKVFHSYLSNRYQRTKINKSCSLWSKIFGGLPQGSVLAPLLINIYIRSALM